MAERATLKDVARTSGVSVAAASRALNDRMGVQPEVRERVKAVATALGYQPNRSARSLVSGRASMIGFVFGGPRFWGTAYAVGLLNEVVAAAEASDNGLAVLADAGDPLQTVRRIVTQNQVDGVIISISTVGSQLAQELVASGLPVVLIGADLDLPEAHSVDVENRESSAKIVEHLFDAGARRVATISGGPYRVDSIERLRGYHLAHKQRNTPVDSGLVFEGNFTARRAYELADEIFDTDAEAVFCANDESARGLHLRATELGRQVPEHLVIAGFDGTLHQSFGQPDLTSVAQPFADIANAAVERLLALIDGETPAPRHLTVEPELHIGNTTSRTG